MTACGYGLPISVPKATFLVAGSGVLQGDLDPIIVSDSPITSVTSFCYLGSFVESQGGMQIKLNTKYLEPLVFLELSEGLFLYDAMFSVTTKCMVYQAVVVGVLLYAVETWPVKQR